MAANSDEASEENMGEMLSPIAVRSLNLEDNNTSENDENANEVQDDEEEEEVIPLLELKKCKEWLLQQKINHESELLVRKLYHRSLSPPPLFFSFQAKLQHTGPLLKRVVCSGSMAPQSK